MSLEHEIKQKARELKIDDCGMIRPEALLDYADRLRERMARIPDGEAVYGWFLRFADIRRKFPWAKSVIVAVLNYGHYALPQNTEGRYGKSYLTDSRFNPDSPEQQKIRAFEAFLKKLGLQVESNEHPGITAMRWAAHKAGLGVIRRNNFFYTEKGSWMNIVAWAADRELEMIGETSLPECPPDCDRCIKACPTKSLSAPYTMNMATCVSRLTTSNDSTDYDEETNKSLGLWIYGCDACQDVCPMNRGKWAGGDAFPGLEDIGARLLPEKILEMSYAEIERALRPKFFYIKSGSLWRWKLNAINALVNAHNENCADLFQNALRDEYEIVRTKADRALRELKMRGLL